ncbi:hypothetical protein HAX54_043133, partial [Datura stramonium]|nr:hypothetical protein [Datura stramonium]
WFAGGEKREDARVREDMEVRHCDERREEGTKRELGVFGEEGCWLKRKRWVQGTYGGRRHLGFTGNGRKGREGFIRLWKSVGVSDRGGKWVVDVFRPTVAEIDDGNDEGGGEREGAAPMEEGN